MGEADDSSRAWFEHERLDVYRVAVELEAASLACVPSRGMSDLRNQLERAATSVVLNIAEGAGRMSPKDKRRFYGTARGSATECAAILEILKARAAAPPEQLQAARALAVRTVQMLTRLSRGPK